MTKHTQDDLWRDFPKTATEFERRFATEEDCRAYWIEARWGGKPACARCGSTYVWPIRDGTTFECRDCDHQTSLTAGTLLEKTRKPLKMWFRAVFEISTRRTGISAMDLMRIMGFGSYKTAWTWLHKLRAALVRPEREPLGPFVQMDEALVGGKGGPHKELVLVAAEADGRVRLAHAATNDKATLKRFADGQIAPDARVTTDGLASYDGDSLGEPAPRGRSCRPRPSGARTTPSRAATGRSRCSKRWLLGTHAGAVGPKHLQAYLDEFAFRHNRRKTNGVGRIAARVIEQLVARQPLTMRSLIDDTRRCRWFRQPELTA